MYVCLYRMRSLLFDYMCDIMLCMAINVMVTLLSIPVISHPTISTFTHILSPTASVMMHLMPLTAIPELKFI